MRSRLHPLAEARETRVRLLATVLQPSTVSQYRHTARRFAGYLSGSFPQVGLPSQLRRDPHILGWIEQLWKSRVRGSGAPLCKVTRAAHLIRLRKLFDLLADHAHPPRPGLLWSEDIPRADQCLPRPLHPPDDAALVAELRRCNDLLSNALLLMRLTGMRIGECVDQAPDCLRHLGEERWAVQVPLGKLHTERWVPVDQEARAVVARLSFLRTLPPSAGEFLLPRPKSRADLFAGLRAALRGAWAAAGMKGKVVPHQLRHTYATSMLRAGISLPALMKLLGHRTANMTLRYVEITQQDLQREFLLAREKPRHLIPVPSAFDDHSPGVVNAATVVERLSAALQLLELYRQQDAAHDRELHRLSRRLIRVRGALLKLIQSDKNKK